MCVKIASDRIELTDRNQDKFYTNFHLKNGLEVELINAKLHIIWPLSQVRDSRTITDVI